MRWLLALVLTACAAPVDHPADETGSASDPAFCVNVEHDGRKYTSNNAPPTEEQAAAGVKQGRYPYPARCIYE